MALGTLASQGITGSNTTSTAVGAFTVTSGHRLFAIAGCRAGSTSSIKPTISDTQSLTWTEYCDFPFDAPAQPSFRITVYTAVSNGSSTTVTATATSATATYLNVISIENAAGGTATNAYFDTDLAGDPSATLDTLTSGYAVAAFIAAGTNNPTHPSGYTEIGQTSGGVSVRWETYSDQASAGTALAWTSSNLNSLGGGFEVFEVPPTGVGSASAIGAATGIGASRAAAVGAAAAAGAATATGSAPARAVGAAAATGSATATSVALAQSTGTASATGDATAAGVSSAVAVGSASGVGAAAASAGGATSGDGAASATGAATATGHATARAVGAAAATATATSASVSAARSVGAAVAIGEATGFGVTVSRAVGIAIGTAVATAYADGFVPGGTGRGRRRRGLGLGLGYRTRPRTLD